MMDIGFIGDDARVLPEATLLAAMPRGKERRRLAIQAYKDNPSTRAVAAQFGVTTTTLYRWRRQHQQETGEKLTRSRRLYQLSARNEAVIAKAHAGETLTEIAAEYGVSRERIRQIVAKHERATGESLGRPGKYLHRKPRVEWTCERCGRSWTTIQSGVGKCRVSCTKSGSISLAQLEELIERRKAGASWADITEAAGYPRNWPHQIQRMIWLHLRRHGLAAEIPAIWRGSATRWLQRKYPMPSVGMAA